MEAPRHGHLQRLGRRVPRQTGYKQDHSVRIAIAWAFFAAALNNLARVYAEGGDHLQAIALTKEALQLCLRQGDRHRVAALHNNLADLYHATGDAESAMEHLKQAVAAFAEIGLEVGDQKPEIWMLTEW